MAERERVLAVFGRLVAEHGDLVLKGKKMPYVALNGNMFAFLSPEGELCPRPQAQADAETEILSG